MNNRGNKSEAYQQKRVGTRSNKNWKRGLAELLTAFEMGEEVFLRWVAGSIAFTFFRAPKGEFNK
jgi:hypothetical protein